MKPCSVRFVAAACTALLTGSVWCGGVVCAWLQEAPLTTHDGMMVDIPQPLTQRFRSNNSTRQPSWDSAQGAPHGGSGSSNNLGAAAGPGGSTGGAAAAGGDFQRSASGGGLRGEASGGGGSGASSRRMSRATSSRPTADQDWGLGAAAAAAATAAVAAAGPATGGGVVGELHVPGPTSRRTSRTLSGGAGAGGAGVCLQRPSVQRHGSQQHSGHRLQVCLHLGQVC